MEYGPTSPWIKSTIAGIAHKSLGIPHATGSKQLTFTHRSQRQPSKLHELPGSACVAADEGDERVLRVQEIVVCEQDLA